jgi:GntR family transcriptional regulator/MocR family aminotransferase
MRYREIYQRIRDAIADGTLVAGDRLPAARTLAAELKVARGTVDSAFTLLAAEGFLISRGRRGTFVSPSTRLRRRSSTGKSSSRTAQQPVSEDLKYLFEAPLPLTPDLPSFDQFPRKLWYRTISRQARKTSIPQLTYPDPFGLPTLRQALASHLAIARGIHCSPEQIIIAGGYAGALTLVCRMMLRPGSRAWVETPGYYFTKSAVEMVGGVAIPISVDADGLNVEEGLTIGAMASLCVLAPSNQFPLGTCLSLRRRVALLEWAAHSKSWIVEADYTGEFRYDGQLLPALKSLDSADRVFYIGTFSKTMFPSLRLGYLVVPQSELSVAKNLMGRLYAVLPALEQFAMTEFIMDGHFGRHLKKMRTLYSARRSALISAVSRVFAAQLDVLPASGGLHLVARLKEDEDDALIEDFARAAGLRPRGLSKMAQGKSCGQGLLLGFGNLPEDEALSTVRILKSAIGP